MAIDREKLLSIGIKRVSADGDRRDRELAKDLASYARLRRSGLQPPGVDGSAKLESEAVTALEINTGVIHRDLKPTERRQMAEAMKEAMDR